jgi:hypothetical protein
LFRLSAEATKGNAIVTRAPIWRAALLVRIAAVGLTVVVSWPSAAQPSQKLFESSDQVLRADESRLLDSDENNAVAHLRGQTMFVKDVKVLRKLNLDALSGKAISIIMPDGEEVTYVGEIVASSPPSIRSWVGVSNLDGHFVISVSAGAAVEGDAAYKGKSYVIRSLASRQRFLFAEIKPLGPHQGEPLSNFQEPSASRPRSK